MADLRLVIGPKNYSSWSIRAWLALRRSGLPFEEVRIRFDRAGAVEEIKRYSAAGKVPVLLHSDVRVWVSLAIAEYVAELAPAARLWPEDPAARACARSVSAEMAGGFENLRTRMPMNARARRPGEGMGPGVAEDIERIRRIWRDCRERFGGDGDFLFGSFTIADAMYAPVVSRFVTYGVSLDAVERAYADAILDWPAVREWMAAAEAEDERLPEYER
jgi:glutathione S-transferase